MTRWIRFYTMCLASGCSFVLATIYANQALKVQLYVKPEPPAAPFDHEEWERKVGESIEQNMRDLSSSAGVPHAYVGSHPYSCALCLTPPKHPIHTIDR